MLSGIRVIIKLMNRNTKIFIAGHSGMVGSSILRLLKKENYENLFFLPSKKLNLEDKNKTFNTIEKINPEIIIMAAAKVGGIYANDTYPYDFIQKNLSIQLNLIEAANRYDIKKFIFLGSSCAYPKLAKQPIKEESLLTGPLEATNRPYAIAKIAGIEMCAALNRQKNKKFLSVMPCNLYGPNDNYDLMTSHVLPALINKIHLAKINNNNKVELWGSGTPLREFMHVDDLSRAIIFILKLKKKNYEDLILSNKFSLINIGSGEEISIKNLAQKIAKIVGFTGQIKFNREFPDGTPRKILNTSKLNKLGWKNKIDLDRGILGVYNNFI